MWGREPNDGPLWYVMVMFGFLSFKDTVRNILRELHGEITKVEAERDLVTAKVLRIVFSVVQRTLLPEG